MSLGRNIAAERVRRGFTKGQLAEMVGLTDAGIARIELESTTNTRTVEKIAAALGVKPSDLFAEISAPPSPRETG